MGIKKGITSFSNFNGVPIMNGIPLFGYVNDTNSSQNLYMSPLGNSQGSKTIDPTDPSNNAQFYAGMIGMAGVCKNFYVWLQTDLGVAGSGTIQIVKNGVLTSMLISIPSGATGNPVLVSDLVNSFSVAATDLIALYVTNNALSANAIDGSIMFEFDPS